MDRRRLAAACGDADHPVKLVVLHYHFQPGGVSQVVRTHLQGLACLPPQHRCSDVLLIGGRDLGSRALPFEVPPQMAVTHRLCPLLDYAPPEQRTRLSANPSSTDSAALAVAIGDLLRQEGCDRTETVLHWHNPTLGKNAATTGAIRHLAEQGWRMLLQIHDFAEDYRPQNYAYLIAALGAANPRELESQLYPQAATIHYATLTRSDREHLRSIGVPDERLHVLPNAVAQMPAPAADSGAARKALRRLGLPSGARLFLYPVRGIRRKNVAELLLLAMLTPAETWFAITLPPTTPIERLAYERWRRLAMSLQLSVVFNAGLHRQDRNTLPDNLAAAEAVVSTSVAEGFGLVFLEPWLAQRSLLARDLPTVTVDLRRAGLQLPSLYQSLTVPLDPADAKMARGEIAVAWQQAWQALPAAFRPAGGPSTGALASGCPAPAGAHDDELDFAMLTPDRQQAVLRRLAADNGFAAAMRDRCADVLAMLATSGREHATEVIAANAATVREVYAPTRQGERLAAIYALLLSAPGPPLIQPPAAAGALWTRFTSEKSFRPCRTEILTDH